MLTSRHRNFAGDSPQYTTSFNATGLPTEGSTLYVRLFPRINNAWQYTDYVYSASGAPPNAL